MVTRLPEELRRRVRVVALLAPSRTASFAFHLTDWLGAAARPGEALPTPGEIARLRGTPVLCFYGTEERDSACTVTDSAVAIPVPLPGGHHLGGDYRWIADRVLAPSR
jgi:type IV secretory pathway VirJ component